MNTFLSLLGERLCTLSSVAFTPKSLTTYSKHFGKRLLKEEEWKAIP